MLNRIKKKIKEYIKNKTGINKLEEIIHKLEENNDFYNKYQIVNSDKELGTEVENLLTHYKFLISGLVINISQVLESSKVHFEIINKSLYKVEKIEFIHELFEGGEQIIKTVDNFTNDVDVKSYGHFITKFTLSSWSHRISDLTIYGFVDIKSKKYNIFCANGTYAVLLFFLKLQDSNTPTFIVLERADTINWDLLPNNWDLLPNNCYFIPSINKSINQIYDFNEFINYKYLACQSFIKELDKVSNNSALFNYYSPDNFGESILTNLYLNGISQNRCHIFLLSDGQDTYLYARYKINDYQLLKDEWILAKNRALIGDRNCLTELVKKYDGVFGTLRNHSAIISEDSNVEFWVSYINFLDDKSKVNAVQKNLDLNELSTDKRNYFSHFFKLDSVNFLNKKNIIFLGGFGYNDKESTSLKNYLKIIKRYYGLDCTYFFKPHPAFKPSLYISIKNIIDECGFIEIESSISAEFLCLKNNNLIFCGYCSTVFFNLEKNNIGIIVLRNNKDKEMYYLDKAEGILYEDSNKYFIKKDWKGLTEDKEILT